MRPPTLHLWLIRVYASCILALATLDFLEGGALVLSLVLLALLIIVQTVLLSSRQVPSGR